MQLLYGTAGADLEGTAQLLAQHLGAGEPHESFFLGGDYYLWRVAETAMWPFHGPFEAKLRHNRELEDELAEPDFGDCCLLIQVFTSSATDIVSWDDLASSAGFRRLR